MNSASYYRQRVAECRAQALLDPADKVEWEKISDFFLRMAERLERMGKALKPSDHI